MKKNLGKKIAFLILGAIFAANAFAETKNVKDIVPKDYYDELINDGYVLRARKKDRSKTFLLLPESQYSDKIRSTAVDKEEDNFAFTYEALYLLNKKDILKTSNSSKETIDIDDVAVVCRSISKMEGMTYYSNSRKKHMVLYEDIYMIDENSLDKRNPDPIPDQNVGNADGQISYFIQDDASFGKNKYKLSYFQNDSELLTEFTLLDKMGKGPFNAVYPGKLKINILVVDCGDDLILYLCTDLDSKKLPGIDKTIVNSMTARMEAVHNWFIRQF